MASNVAVTTSLSPSISASCSVTGSSAAPKASSIRNDASSALHKHSFLTQLDRRSSLERTFAANRREFVPSGKLQQRRQMAQGARALFGNNDSAEGKKEDKKFITKEQEPEQYWQTTAEKEGKNPMQSVLPYIAIMGLLTPFTILALAFANNWIKLPR